MIIVLCSCQKYSEPPVHTKSLKLEEFVSMLSKENTYSITSYYTSNAVLSIPEVNADDTYTFDGSLSDGWVSSKQPCVEYHYNFKAFSSQSNIVIDWLDFNISPTTFVVEDYKPGEFFVLRSVDKFVRYELR